MKTGGQLELSLGHERQIAVVVALLEQIPRELITLEPSEYAKLVAAEAYLKTAVESFQLKGSSAETVRKIPGLGPLSPLTIIYDALLHCPDTSPPLELSRFPFLDDDRLRVNLASDVGSAVLAARDAQWKAATVLGGSVVEALLHWVLSRWDPAAVAAASRQAVERKTLKVLPPKDVTSWSLAHYIAVARELPLISENTAKLCDAAREYRNLIHPGATERLAVECDNSTAYAALAAAYAVSRDLARTVGSPAPGNGIDRR